MKHLLRALAITLCFAFAVTAAQAQTITAEQAKEIADSFFSNGKQKSAAARSAAVSFANSAGSRILASGSEAPTFHVFTPASGKGFVIVSGEEMENPIIGYSFDSEFTTEGGMPAGLADYLAGIDAQIRTLRERNASNPQKAAAARSAMQKTNYNATTMGDKVYLETASWGQNTPFNDQCWTSTGQTVHAKTGCVPTAYAIIMRYHEWPLEGTGNLVNGQSGATITDRTYDYSKMPLVYDGNWSTEQINEVAKLMSHLGHAFMVTFGSGSTSVSDPQSTDKPNKFFNYNLVYASYQENFTIDAWKEKIRESIDNGCPIPYASDNAGTGDTRHMFVLDGYTANDYFHFNFGWNGGSNGWFKLDAITPSQGDNYSWQDGADHYAIFNFTPNKTKYTVSASVSPENAGTVSINGSATADTSTGEYLEGATVTLTAAANGGYTFSHWSKGTETISTSKSCQAKVASSDNSYVANFLTIGSTTVNIAVTYNSSYGTVTNTSGTVASGSALTPRQNEEIALTATPLDGYTFTGWTVTKGTESTSHSSTVLTLIATGEMSVTANFALAIQDYAVTPETGTLNNGTSRSSVWTYTTGGNFTAALSISATDSEGNAVNSITNKTSGSAGHYFASSGIIASTETSSSSPTTYTISVPDGYKITGYDITYYPENGSITVTNELGHSETATSSSSDYYIKASGLSVQSTTYTVAGTGRMTTLSFVVTVMKDESAGGGSTSEPESATYNVTATASPAEGGTATLAAGTGQQTSSATVAGGTQITLYAVANTGYRFVNWTSGTSTISNEASANVTITANSDFVANFEAEEQELPITGTKLEVTFSGAAWNEFDTNNYTNQVVTAAADDKPAVTIKSTDGNKIGYGTRDNIRKPYLLKNSSFTVSVPEPYRIAGYKLTVEGVNFNAGELAYTIGSQLTRSNTATATIGQNGVEQSVIATGLDTNEVNIALGDATADAAGVIITALEIDYAEASTEYPAITGTTAANRYLTSATSTGADTNINYSASAHPGSVLVEVPGTIQAEAGASFTLNLIAKSLGTGSTSFSEDDIRYCHASLFTDFDRNFTFEENPAQTWGVLSPSGNNPYAGGQSHIYGNYDLVMNITANVTVPDNAPLGTSRVRVIYTNAWDGYPTNGTSSVSNGIVYDFTVEIIEKVSITANANEGGTVTVNGEAAGTKRVIKGTTVTLAATPNSGYEFASWTNSLNTAVITENPYTVTATADAQYTASFNPVSAIYTISVSATEGGTAYIGNGTATEVEVTAGNSVTLTAEENTGYNFAGWYRDNAMVSEKAEYTFIPDASAEYVAKFEKAPATGGSTQEASYETNSNNGTASEQNPNTSENSFYKAWICNNSQLVITSSGYTISANSSGISLRTADSYTISVPEGLEIASYTLNFNAYDNATIKIGDESSSIAKANNQTFTVEEINAGSASFALTVNNSRYIQITSIDMVLKATGYTISVAAGEGGNAYVGETGTATETTIAAGGNVTLRAETIEGYDFDGWYDSCGKFISDEPTYALTPGGSMAYTAKFYAPLCTGRYYRFQCQGSNKYYLSSNINDADNNRLAMNGANRIFYYGTLINEFNDVDDAIEENQKKLLAYTEGDFVGVKKRDTGDYYDVTLLDNRNETSYNVKFNAGTDGHAMIGVEYVDEEKNSIYLHLDGNGASAGSSTNVTKDDSHNWVCEEVASLPVTIYDVQHATLYAPVALEIPEGVRAYVLDASNIDGTSKDIVLTRLSSIIPANTGVILKGSAGTYDFNITTSTDEADKEAANNALAGTAARTRVAGDAYILSERDGKIGLYPLSTNSYLTGQAATANFTNGSHKAYLPVKDDILGEILKKGAEIRFLFSDETATGIDEVNTESGNAKTICDLKGRKLSKATKPGIYIINGKKVFIKGGSAN